MLSEPNWIEHGWLNLLQSAIEAFPRKREELARLYSEKQRRGRVATPVPVLDADD